MIEATHLTRRYGPLMAVDNVSFQIGRGEIVDLLGSGSRFASITRGVIDLRDLYYYLSLLGVFFTLTAYSLERLRWARNGAGNRHRLWKLLTLLLVANLLAGNLWLHHIGRARLDLTEGKIYSLSKTSHRYLQQLRDRC